MQTKIKTIVEKTLLEHTGLAFDLAPADKLVTSGHIDSLGLIKLVMALQDRFQVHLDVADLSVNNFETLAAIAELLESRILPRVKNTKPGA